MNGILQSIRTTLLMAFRTLPLILVSFVGFLAMGLGNMGLFILFVGQVLIVPITTMLLQGITGMLLPPSGVDGSAFFVRSSNVGLIVPDSSFDSPFQNVAPSFWMMHVLFFATYMVSNAIAILYLPVDSKLDPIIVSNRKSKAKTIIAVIVGMTALVTILRFTTNTETPAGIMLAILAACGLGYGWYELAAMCGARAADVFGVMQQILPSSATADKPMTCVYAPKP
jgi:hypothetical protein